MLHRRLLITLLILWLAFSPLSASAQENALPAPHLVKDIGTCKIGSQPVFLFQAGNIIYYKATTSQYGTELWRSDGTESGTRLVYDFNGTQESSNIRLRGNDGVSYYLSTQDSWEFDDYFLWAFNPQNEEATFIYDFTDLESQLPESGISYSGFARLGNEVYFIAQEERYGIDTYHPHLWKTDGTPAGTQEIATFTTTAQANILISFAGEIFFIIENGNSIKLWRYDASAAGMVLVKTIETSGGEFQQQVASVGDTMYFFIPSAPSTGKPELWMSDGTPEGTQPVPNVPSAATYAPLLYSNGNLFFSIATSQDDQTVYELWGLAVDLHSGQPGTAQRIHSIEANSSGSFYIIGIGDLIYFFSSETGGKGLWRTDGSAENTLRLFAAADTDTSYHYINRGTDPYLLFGWNGAWISDGTSAGTVALENLDAVSASAIAVTDQGKIFAIEDIPCIGKELVITDSPTGSVDQVKDMPIYTESTSPRAVGEYAGKAYFLNTNDEGHLEWWKTDGTEAGTTKIYEFDQTFDGYDFYFSYAFVEAGGLLYLRIWNNLNKYLTIWRTDGTTEGTWLVKLGTVNTWEKAITSPVAYHGYLYYLYAYGFRRLDGSEGLSYNGGQIILDFPGSASITGPVEMGGYLYFTAAWSENGIKSYRLWRSDGTPEGTIVIATIEQTPLGVENWKTNMVRAGDKLYFVGSDLAHGNELWESDGTPQGTQMVADLTPGETSTLHIAQYAVGDTLYFVTDDGVNSILWKTRGKASGVQQVDEKANIMVGDTLHTISITLLAGDEQRLYYRVIEPNDVYQLWKTDGTPQGTQELYSLYQYISNTEIYKGYLFFTGIDEAHGAELWYLDCKTGQGQVLADLRPGPNPSGSKTLGVAAGKLWISGYDYEHGRELWVLDLSETHHLYLPGIMK